MTTIDRILLRKLLGMLGSHHDGEVLNAARRIDAMMRSAGVGWDALISTDKSEASDTRLPEENGNDLMRLRELLVSELVADVLKIRLRDMQMALSTGQLSPADRRLLRILHRKAVVDGTIIER